MIISFCTAKYRQWESEWKPCWDLIFNARHLSRTHTWIRFDSGTHTQDVRWVIYLCAFNIWLSGYFQFLVAFAVQFAFKCIGFEVQSFTWTRLNIFVTNAQKPLVPFFGCSVFKSLKQNTISPKNNYCKNLTNSWPHESFFKQHNLCQTFNYGCGSFNCIF